MNCFPALPQKYTRRRRRTGTLVALLPTLGLLASSAHAQQYRVTLDTTGLSPTSILTTNFNLTNSGGVSGLVNASSFLFGGGSPSGTPTTSGGAGGNLSSSVSLTGSSFSNDFAQNFNRGTQFGFLIDASQLTPKADQPDRFTFSLTDPAQGGAPIATNADDGFSLFALERTTSGFVTEAYGYTGPNNVRYTVQVSAVPELSLSVAFGLASAGGMGVLVRRRVRRAA